MNIINYSNSTNWSGSAPINTPRRQKKKKSSLPIFRLSSWCASLGDLAVKKPSVWFKKLQGTLPTSRFATQ